jgi:peptidyl-prolyl cis-trans isomerase C
VQTQFGWHVIKLIDIRTAQPLPYDKVKDGIQKNLQQRDLEKMMAELRTKAKIDINK